MPSRRHLAASLSFLASICVAMLSAFSRAAWRDSIAKIALSASPAHRVCRGLTLASTLRMKAPLVTGLRQQLTDCVSPCQVVRENHRN
ncbi:hypothetical protein BMON_1767 [Bifidobacterium mongoliense DSM 21395]|uniref:Uncharacterized protein n=1 Tax=Bifidobacterium mongoliense DSM 21395 TaxID=1437603 RepID=A0A087BVK6_9BIFI|nr:hypothetical protein BMON_1767 [Bifidobacterium mongoliense DSM 21395]